MIVSYKFSTSNTPRVKNCILTVDHIRTLVVNISCLYLRLFWNQGFGSEKKVLFWAETGWFCPRKSHFMVQKSLSDNVRAFFWAVFLVFTGFSSHFSCQIRVSVNKIGIKCSVAKQFLYIRMVEERGCISYSQNFSDTINLKIREMRLEIKVEFDFAWLKYFALTDLMFCNGWKTQR